MCLGIARRRAKENPNGGWYKLLAATDYCFYCDVRLVISKVEGFISNKLTFDHIVPKSKGGKNHLNNVVKCCEQCNCDKSSRDFMDFAISKILEEELK